MESIRIISPQEVPAHLGAGGRRTRVLLDPETGHPGLELYHVELVPGAASEVHARDHAEALIVLEGVAGVKTGETLHRAEAGEIILIPAGVEHQHVNAGEGTNRFLGIFAPPTGNAADVRSRPLAED
jgi:quercetin dioxygenase-like cupin family protein